MIKFGEAAKALLNDLLPDEMNPRVMPDREMKSLMQAIREFGFVQPVVVRKDDGLIIGGHQRLEALKRILLEDGIPTTGYKVPVVWVTGISDERARLLNVALNKIHGEWDFEKLGAIFQEVAASTAHGAESPPLAASGFSDREIDDILKMTVADAASASLGPADAPPVDVDAELAARARKFAFEAATDEEAAVIREAVTAFGGSHAAMARAALTHIKCEDAIT